MRAILTFIAAIAAACAASGALAAGPRLPAAVYQDPPHDPAHPASGDGIQFESHGATINGMLYRPAGAGPHPTVIMLHGLPGNEQNLDLARAIQRAGWTVIAFHYRGAWGSGGTYSLAGGVDDARALLALLRQPERARAWGVDPKRIVLVGHSYGGYVAAAAMAQEPGVSGGVLIAPWDISEDARAWSHLTPEARRAAALDNFNDVNGRLTGADAVSLTEEVMAVGPRLDLAKTAAAIADRPLLVLTATRDTVDDQAKALLPALRSAHAAHLRVAQMQTDHGFDDSRIALEAAVLRWLAQFTAQVR